MLKRRATYVLRPHDGELLRAGVVLRHLKADGLRVAEHLDGARAGPVRRPQEHDGVQL